MSDEPSFKPRELRDDEIDALIGFDAGPEFTPVMQMLQLQNEMEDNANHMQGGAARFKEFIANYQALEEQKATLTRERNEAKAEVARVALTLNQTIELQRLSSDELARISAGIETLKAQLQSATLTGIRAGLEEALDAAKTFPDKVLVIWERPGGPPGNGYRATTPDDIVAIIRALSPQSILDKLTKTEGAK